MFNLSGYDGVQKVVVNRASSLEVLEGLAFGHRAPIDSSILTLEEVGQLRARQKVCVV